MRFSDQLSFILEEQTTQCGGLLETATDIAHQIESTKQYLSDLKRQLAMVSRKVNANLATIIRRENPSLNVSVTAEGCKIGYKSKNLVFYPDVFRGIWTIDSHDEKFLNRFKRQHRRSTILEPDINSLSSAIIQYFTLYYKSLNEEIVGQGTTLVDGKSVSLRELVEYREKLEWSTNV